MPWPTVVFEKDALIAGDVKIHCGSGGIRTHASEETGALNQRLRLLGHATLQCFQMAVVKATCHRINVYGHITLNTPVLVRSLLYL